MLDAKFIKENTEDVKAMLKKRGVDVDVDSFVTINDSRITLITKIEALRAERNAISKKHSPENVARSKEIKQELKDLDTEYKDVEAKALELQMAIPNMLHPDVPEGHLDEDNVELKRVGDVPEFSFPVKDHETLGKELGMFDIAKASEVCGAGFYYLTGDAVLLEFALVKYALDALMAEGFIPMITPELVRKQYASSTGYLPKREEPDIYKIENEDLYLIATAEIPLAAYHAKETLQENDLPKKYAGFSSCFRKEAGAHGKHKKGIFRVHQFDKIEMFAFVKPEESMDMFHSVIAISEKLFQGLGIPYRVVSISSGDMNGPGHIKYDIEYWSPVDKEYREITSGTNTTDYQARRLSARYKNAEGKTEFVHTVNNTGFAIGRTLIAIMENFQNEDGTITIPEVLRQYVGKDVITPL
ncbi:MAG: serine--tRNA ligase [Waddliaceae bacterium]|jgi:seryl-tRNA synthetase|nr:serine--tRNA ligase [Waddliaceae bacterium]MBT3578577.1 serine--tRNA ligase [Waddliaceae bacterium]MBT4444499.1 serine--tRNA ligase [Waddliaceae bacterium]MBT6928255.1 serine--tRNA ligase [Waddliaceae bacterium]